MVSFLELKKCSFNLDVKLLVQDKLLWFEQKPVIKAYAEKIQKLKLTSKSEEHKDIL